VAIVTVLVATWVVTARGALRLRVIALAAVVVLAIAGSFVRAKLLERDPTFRGGGFREQFYETSFRMIADRPLAGVGIGQYYFVSSLYLTPQMAWTYGFENAHNYFLQIGAELGLAGLLLFTAFSALGGAALVMAIRHVPDSRLLGATAGVLAFLGTCLTGHPLLTSEVAYPFWIQFGLAIGLAGSAVLNSRRDVAAAPSSLAPSAQSRRAWATVAVFACWIVAVTVAGLRAGPLEAPRSQAVDGFYRWEVAEDGRRFRWTEQFASIVVPKAVTRVLCPVRIPTDRRMLAPMGVEVSVDGRPGGRALATDSWSPLDVALGPADPRAPFRRVNFKMDRVWQPALYVAGNADLRHVAVQVGECELTQRRPRR
jgi:O-Antigen ligase